MQDLRKFASDPQNICLAGVLAGVVLMVTGLVLLL